MKRVEKKKKNTARIVYPEIVTVSLNSVSLSSTVRAILLVYKLLTVRSRRALSKESRATGRSTMMFKLNCLLNTCTDTGLSLIV